MKTKIKRHSRSALAVILTLCMLVSCMTVGIIASDAARVTDSGAVAAKVDDTDSSVAAKVNSESVGAVASGKTLIVNVGALGSQAGNKYYAYFYGGSVSGSNQWQLLTAITSGAFNGKYYCTVPAGSPTHVIITKNQDNSGWDAKKAQTVDTSLSNNYLVCSSTEWEDGKVKTNCYDRIFQVLVKNNSTETNYELTEDNGSGVFSVTTPAITAAATHLEVKNHETQTSAWYGPSGDNYWLNDTVVGNSYTVTASVDIKNVSTSNWDGSTFSKTLVSSASTFSLTGNIDSTYIASINGVANTLDRGSSSDADWWKAYHSEAAINTAESGTNVYSITFTTVDAATLATNGHNTIDIGLSIKGNTQKAFQIGGTYYNYIGGDYKVTSAGVTDQNIVDLAATNGGGSLIIQPGRTYKLTVDETNNHFSIECTSGDKYFLAGQYSDGTPYFFGTVWTTSNNELTETSSGSGVYEKTFTTNIPAGTINFKVVKNGDSDGWDGGSWPKDGNQSYVIKANATSVKFSFSTSTEKTTVTQENSSSSGGGTWPPTDTAVTNVTESSTTTSKYLVVASNDNFNNSTAIALEKKYSDSSNYFYWADLTDYLSYNNIHMVLSSSTSASNRIGSHHKVNDSAFAQGSKDSIEIKSGSTTLFKAKESERSSAYRAEVYDKDSSLNHFGVLIRTNKSSESDNWTEYAFYYTDYVAPVVETKVVDIYAKDACLRDDTFNRFARLATTEIDTTYFDYTDADNNHYTSISDYNDANDLDITYQRESYGGTDAGYTKMTNVPVGAKVKIKTTLSDNASAQGSFDNKAFKETHYVKGYSFNGVTYQINEWESDGVYEEIWTVRAVNTTYHDANNELQIYYMKDNKNCKTFYIDGYDGTVQNAWGNMLCVYPYYEGKSNKDNAFGGYPGQPMLLWGGKYQMEIPLTVDGTASGASVKGLTLHNAYWDLLHRSIDIRCNARNHAQTYDYDDFYKLYKEKNPDTIIFDFKYKTANDNFGDGYGYFNYEFAGTSGQEHTKDAAYYAASGKNGVEIVTDYFGRQVDVFGNLLTDAQKSDYDSSHPQDKELLIVSTGYKDTYVGEYATLWAVYAPQSSIPSGSKDTAGKFIGLISSSELYLNTWDNASKYPVSDHGLLMTDSRFENTYKHLKDYYTGVPALITYEREIWNDSKDKANRSDGKWYYSNTTDKISANIKIQYGSYTLLEAPDHSVSSNAWNDDPFDTTKTGVGGEKNIGTNTGCSAYFTNTNPNLMGKVASGEQFADSKKSFTFQAVPSGSYMFAGWVRYSNGKYYEITENEIGESPMSANDVYIARFVDAQTGSLTVQHVVEQTATYTGTGTPAVTVTVKNGSGTDVETFTNSTVGEKLDISKWIDSHYAAYTIDISLTTTPTNESYMKEIVSSSGNFAATPASWTGESQTSATNATVEQFTVQEILDSGVTSLRYVSHLQKPTYTYKYEITYTYNSRFWGEQSYTVTGTFANDSEFSANTTGSKNTAKLNTDFIINKTPYEKTFRQQINWNYTTTAVPAASGTGNVGANAMENNVATDQGSNTYRMTAHVYASKTVNDKVTAEFVLPYKYNEKAQGYTVKDTDVYNSSGTKSGTSYLYDSGNESVTLSTKAYSLFTYDDENHTGSDDIQASSLPLMEAAPYLMTNLGDNDYHYKLTDNIRYYTGKSFKVGNTTYYLSQDDVPQNPGTYKVLTASDSVNFTKIKYAGTDKTTTYHFAVEDTSGGAKGQYGYKIYFFSYVTDDFGNYVDNNGNSSNTPVFNGQYCVYSVGRDKDGMIEGTGVKKYFTRWDIYNTKGDFVASCYNRRFNFSGYDNYIVKPVYASDTEQTYASSTQNDISASITYLDDSRNQWKGTGASGSYHSVTGQTDLYAGDKIFTDFAITYNYNGLNLNLVPNAANNGADIKVGMIVERLDELDSVGTTKITGATYYADKYKSDNSWTAIKTALEGNSSLTTAVRNAGGTGHSCYHERIASNCSAANYQATLGGTPATGSTTLLMGFDTAVDNFNRLQWFYTINNTTQATSGSEVNDSGMRNYAYRAISYIMVGNTAYLCSTPTYFTIYDTATRTGN